MTCFIYSVMDMPTNLVDTKARNSKYRRFRHLLLNIHKLPLEAQKAYLDESMDAWRGTYEQVSDLPDR